MRRKRSNRGAELCITVEPSGVYAYANKAALRALAAELHRLAESDAHEHSECHVRMELGGHWRRRKPTWVLFDAKTRRAFSRPQDFELTFMAVEAKDLRRLRARERKGLLPHDGWRTATDHGR